MQNHFRFLNNAQSLFFIYVIFETYLQSFFVVISENIVFVELRCDDWWENPSA